MNAPPEYLYKPMQNQSLTGQKFSFRFPLSILLLSLAITLQTVSAQEIPAELFLPENAHAGLDRNTMVYVEPGAKRGHVADCRRVNGLSEEEKAKLDHITLAELEKREALLCSNCPGSHTPGRGNPHLLPNPFPSWVNPPPVGRANQWKAPRHEFEPSPNAPLVSVGSDGKLVYRPFSEKGDQLMDFSKIGYKLSEVPIPEVRVVETLTPPEDAPTQMGTMKYPVGKDSFAEIQSALNRVAAMPADADGFRGAVLLKKGTWYVSQGLLVESGVVLRGEGDGDDGTTLIFNETSGEGTGIQLGRSAIGGTTETGDIELSGLLTLEPGDDGEEFFHLQVESGFKFPLSIGGPRTEWIGAEMQPHVNKQVTLGFKTLEVTQGGETSLRLRNNVPNSVKLLAEGEKGEPLNPDLILPGMDAGKEYPEIKITDAYIPTGSYQITVADASDFQAGDTINIFKISNQAWIDELGVGERLQHIRGGKEGAGKRPWGPQKFRHTREVTAVDGNVITINQPLPQSIAEMHGGGTVQKTEQDLDTQCGVEFLRIFSNYDTTVKDSGKDANFKNLKNGISVTAKDSWVRNVAVKHVWFAAVQADGARDTTIRDCQLTEPVGPKRGGRYYAFNIGNASSGILFLRCYAEDGRHDFVVGARTSGPNAFVECTALRGGQSEPHARWGSGTLYDNITMKETGSLAAINRGDSGSGHGWAAANTVFWNCDAERIIVANPETIGENNFAIGFTGEVKDDYDTSALYYANTRAGYWGTPKEGKYYGYAIMGDGHIESPGAPVEPRSLYKQQLIERIGEKQAALVLQDKE
jgi:hypothetical protein